MYLHDVHQSYVDSVINAMLRGSPRYTINLSDKVLRPNFLHSQTNQCLICPCNPHTMCIEGPLDATEGPTVYI